MDRKKTTVLSKKSQVKISILSTLSNMYWISLIFLINLKENPLISQICKLYTQKVNHKNFSSSIFNISNKF